MRTIELPPVGHLVEVSGIRLWTHKSGVGRHPVVFVPGAGGVGLDFFLAHERVAKFTTAVVYDRAGTGWSADIALPRSTTEVTDELRTFLSVIGVQSPVVLVGHSLGGAYVQRYAQRFPDEVAAMLLIEPIHEDWNDYMPDDLKIEANSGADDSILEITEDLLAHFRNSFTETFSAFPHPLREILIDKHLSPERLLTGFHEGANVLAIFDELRLGGARPDVPLIVLSGTEIDAAQKVFASEDQLRQQITASEQLFESIAANAPHGEHRILPGATHVNIPMSRPDAVAAAVCELAARV
ncbi:alpha/beta hydrolase [Sphingomonas sp. So64.6b]|uniref:alpha/beta fold hydrolase n=1 Tax=Sphingomonas sp. So64.6b TaxID=2997354 RepID=UPI001601D771|nr:alpha/beta hydrolase [Sphingomonas sp. So64.6b]QNA82611.1 alpha/beta hydrolase [Sphingomonas sp. So64.6b]